MGEGPAWPRILVVTNRRQLVAAAGTALADWPDVLRAQVAGALAGGADLVQIREPDLDARTLAAVLRRLFADLPDSAGHVVVNDRVDAARVTGAAGVHLAERSVSVGEARLLQPPGVRWVVGRSVHDAAAASVDDESDYLLVGTVRPSASKPPGWRTLGWTGLADVARAAGARPVVAIGGLGPADVDLVRRAGAAGIAGIGCFLPIQGESVAISVQERVRAMRIAFDRT